MSWKPYRTSSRYNHAAVQCLSFHRVTSQYIVMEFVACDLPIEWAKRDSSNVRRRKPLTLSRWTMSQTPLNRKHLSKTVRFELFPGKFVQRLCLGAAAVCSMALWGVSSFAATLTWNANTEPDLAGYRVYQCNQLPCSRSAGTASLLATLGTVTSFNIGTPTTVRHYVVTAYDLHNNESNESNVATYTPPSSSPSPTVSVSPTSLSFTTVQGSSNPSSQTLNVSNTGGGTFTWSSSGNAPWLTHTPQSGTGNGIITVSVATESLSAGTYTATITVSATGGGSVSVPVTVTVNAPTVSPPPRPLNLQLRAVVPGSSR
ncbi:MAG: BACON domain-containing protein [Nitrospira sp.]|nr:BACON domain-containing protein [Nitrospira sp.]